MSQWSNFRAWINRNDGKFFQLEENFSVNWYQAVAAIILCAAILLLRVEALSSKSTFGWIALVIGIALGLIGMLKGISDERAP